MDLKDKPYYTLPAASLAEWIERQPEKWWSVDGDSFLMSVVDFPCPGDELAPVIRRVGKSLLLQDKNASSAARGEVVGSDRLDELSDTANKRKQKTLRLSWQGSDEDWLLIEDEALVPK